MTKYEILSILISFLGLLTAIFSFKAAKNSEKSAKETSLATKLIDRGMLEIQVRNTINQAAFRRDDLMIKIHSDRANESLAIAAESALENWLNAYDEACGLYIDNKIDSDRFKKNYYNEITGLIEDENLEEYFNPEYKSKYQKLLMVYKEWTNLELKEK